MFTGSFVPVPVVKTKAADSPIILPIAKIVPVKIPGMAQGNIM